jgi:CO/xanthine dehydrogenase FAD-binding subunit
MADVLTALTLAGALEHLSGDRASRPLAGGVGVLLGRALERGGLGIALPPSGHWIDVRSVPELRGIRRLPDGRCQVGAAVTIAELESGDVPEILRVAASAVGNPGIRAVATIGGNLVGSGASSDLMAALVALGAVALVEGSVGARRIPVARVPRLLGIDRAPASDTRASLLLRGVEMGGAGSTGWGFERLTFQGAMDRAAATVAVVVSVSRGQVRAGGEPIRACMAATSVADRPVRFPRIERQIAVDPGVGAGDLEALALADLAAVALRSDLRVSDWYRRAVIPVLVRRAVAAALDRADVAGPR